MTSIINCRYCDGERQVVLGICTGCGSPRSMAARRMKGRKKAEKCPKCKSPRIRLRETKEFHCMDCGAEFEAYDFSFLDDRPENNAIKKGM